MMITRGGIGKRNISGVQTELGTRAGKGYERYEAVRNYEKVQKSGETYKSKVNGQERVEADRVKPDREGDRKEKEG